MKDIAILGDAILEVTEASRINYEILGNIEVALHAHVFPRYATEPENLRQKPVWFYDWGNAPEFCLERDQSLMNEIAQSIKRLT